MQNEACARSVHTKHAGIMQNGHGRKLMLPDHCAGPLPCGAIILSVSILSPDLDRIQQLCFFLFGKL